MRIKLAGTEGKKWPTKASQLVEMESAKVRTRMWTAIPCPMCDVRCTRRVGV